MAQITLSSLFSILCDYIPGSSQDKIYEDLFHLYLHFYKMETNESTVSRIRSGKNRPSANMIEYYSAKSSINDLTKDIETNILTGISHKFELCNEIVKLFDESSIDERDKESVLKYYPDNEEKISLFLAKAFIFAINSPITDKNASPIVAERVTLPVISPCKHFSGRKKELETLHEMLQTHDKIFIYGIGGIGKSEFVKQYISDHKKEYTNILYMTYSGSLKSTIASLDFHDDKSRDSVDTRFYRHNIFLKHLKNDSLIIIDNFDIMPDMDDHLEEILSYNCKIIFTTRNHFDDYNLFELSEMDTNTLMLIAKSMNINESADMLSRLFSAVHNHTLSCELILKLLQKSAYTSEKLFTHLMNDHVKLDIADKIRRTNKASATYYGHIQILFDLISLTAEQKDALRILSLIPVSGIGDRYFCKLTATKNMNPIIELDEMGLIRYADHNISIHPLIAETAAAELVPDMDNCRTFLNGIMAEAAIMIDDKINRIRRLIILPTADRVMEFTCKNDMPYYIHFLNSMCTYAEVFEDTRHMRKFISEIDTYIDASFDGKLNAVHLMSKAAYARIANNDNSAAIKFTLKAAEYIPHDLSDEAAQNLAINVNNNLLRFYLDRNDLPRAQKYRKKVEEIFANHPIANNNSLVMLLNLSELCMKQQDFPASINYINTALQIYYVSAPNSEDYAHALLLAAEIQRAYGDEKAAQYYVYCANKVLGGLMLGNNDIKQNY